MQERILSEASRRDLGKLTLRAIARLIGESYPQKVKHHLLQLQKKGLIRIDKKKQSIERVLPGVVKDTNLISIPVYGAANCGEATLLAEEKLEGYLMVSRTLLKKNKAVFALRAEGTSMNTAMVGGQYIEDGDYILVDASAKDAKDGDVVVSIINGMANVKRFRRDKQSGLIILMSDSTKKYPPIYIDESDDFYLNGKVVQVLKKPQD